ncbi:hypothetical protein KCU71_g5200, partial [Aureobasidium melanogenum]
MANSTSITYTNMSNSYEIDQQWLDSYATGHDHSPIFESGSMGASHGVHDHPQVRDCPPAPSNLPVFNQSHAQQYASTQDGTALHTGPANETGACTCRNRLGRQDRVVCYDGPYHQDSFVYSGSTFGELALNGDTDVQPQSQPYFHAPLHAPVNHGTPVNHGNELPVDPTTFPQNDPYFNEDLMMNDTSSTATPHMEMSAALQRLRSGNPFLNTADPEPIHDFQAPFNPLFNAWESSATEIIRSNNFCAQQLPVSDAPQVLFPIHDGMSTNNNPRGATMLDASNDIEGPLLKNGDNTNVSRRVNQRSNTRGLRVTCEACRKLKIKCLPRGDSEACEKCHKNGTPCERKARAAYPKRATKKTLTSALS